MGILALDMSDTILRLAMLERQRGGWRLPVRAELPLPPGLIVDGDIQQPTAVSQSLRQLHQAAGLKSRRIILAIPERHSFVKLLALPSNRAGSLAEAVRSAVTQDLPYSLEEVYWDWHDVRRRDSLNQSLALVGAAPKTTVDGYLRVVAAAGLEAARVEIESLAIARAQFGLAPPGDTRMILDLGRTRSTLILVDRGLVQFTSTIRYAGRELNRFIADELGVTADQAEKAKTVFGLDPQRGQGLLRRILSPHIDAVGTAIREAEKFYVEHMRDHQPIAAVHVTGSGALLRGIDAELRQRLDHEIVVQPSWVFQQLQRTDPALPVELGYTFTTVLGLGLDPDSSRS